MPDQSRVTHISTMHAGAAGGELEKDTREQSSSRAPGWEEPGPAARGPGTGLCPPLAARPLPARLTILRLSFSTCNVSNRTLLVVIDGNSQPKLSFFFFLSFFFLRIYGRCKENVQGWEA